MKEHDSPRDEGASFIWLTAGLWLILAYPLLGTLWHHHYPLLSPEVFLIGAGWLGVSATLAFLMTRIGLLVRSLLLAMFLLLAFTVHFNLLLPGMLSVFLVAIVLALLMKNSFPRFLAPVLLVLIVAARLDSLVQPATSFQPVPDGPGDQKRGPVIHVLMDAFMAPDGLASAPEVANGLDEQIVSFFVDNDFELQARSYSHYANTLDSMTRLFGFRNDNENLFVRQSVMRVLPEYPDNRWFRILSDMGYQLSVYQNEAMDFCTARGVEALHCNQFSNPNLRSVRHSVPGSRERARVLLDTMVNQSSLLISILNAYQLMGSWGVSVFDERIIERMLEDIARRPDGAYFAHVLLPHAPLVLDSACGWDYGERQVLRWPAQKGAIGNSDQSRDERYSRIVRQYECALFQLEKLFDELKQLGIYDEATIIVHGDHGTGAFIHSPAVYNLERLTGLDLRESYSALFAVKYPGGTGRLVRKTASLNALMAEAAMRITGKSAEELEIGVIEEPHPFVYLTNSEPFQSVRVDIYSDL